MLSADAREDTEYAGAARPTVSSETLELEELDEAAVAHGCRRAELRLLVLQAKWREFSQLSADLVLERAVDVENGGLDWTCETLEMAERLQREATILLPLAKGGFILLEDLLEAQLQNIGAEDDLSAEEFSKYL